MGHRHYGFLRENPGMVSTGLSKAMLIMGLNVSSTGSNI